MSNEQDGRKNDKYVNLAKKVNDLTKIVNELQAEVDNLKSRCCRPNEKGTQIPEEPKIENEERQKSSRFQRLNCFCKDNKTKEKTTEIKAETPGKSQARSNKNESSDVYARTTSNDNQRQTTSQPRIREPSGDKSNQKSRSTQHVSFPKEVEFSCFVQTCGVQTENNNEDSASSQENTESESNCNAKTIEPSYTGCDKPKKQKIKPGKSNTGRCGKDCPYLARDNKDIKKKKNKCKKEDASVETCCKDQSYVSRKKTCKNKKTNVNFVKDDKIDSSRLNEAANTPLSTLHLLDHDGKCAEVKETFCKRCFKKCKTKNVLKINKAILTHEPPVIVMPPRKC